MQAPAILDRLRGVQRAGKGWLAFCAGHDDVHKRSLSIALGADGRTLLKCHAAGCPAERIAGAVGMTLVDLAPTTSPNGRGARHITAAYAYKDRDGAVLFEVVRFSPKDFRCRRPDGRGGWTWNMEGIRRVVYRLPELVGPRVFWVEGEKDADRLAGLGLAATTSPGGADAFRDAYARQLADLGVREVVVLPDNDDPGRAYAQRVAEALTHVGVTARLCVLPDLRPKGDVSDWLDAGGSREALEALADAAPVCAPRVSSEPEPAPTAVSAPTACAAEPAPMIEVTEDEIVLSWATHGVQITAARAHLRESGGTWRAELNVTRGGRHLLLADLALASTAARRTEAKALTERDPDAPWAALLDQATRVLVDVARTSDGAAVELVPEHRPAASRYLLEPLVLAGHPTILYGDGGAGKGWLALALSVALAHGLKLPGCHAPSQVGPVLYLDWESDRADQAARLELLGHGLGIGPVRGLYYRRMTRVLSDAAPAIRADIRALGAVAVVVDSLVPASGGGDRPWHDVAVTVFGALRTFSSAAQLIVAHVSKVDADRPGQGARPFGSSFNWNLARSAWEVRRAEPGADDDLVLGLYHRKANSTALHRPLGLRFLFGPPGSDPERVTVHAHDLEREPALIARTSIAQQILAALREGARPVADLAATLGRSEATLRGTLKRLREHHAVVKLPDGSWGLAHDRGA
jgi:hypothetical protein